MTGHAWLDAVLAIAVGMLVFWLLLVAMLALSRPQGPMLPAALRRCRTWSVCTSGPPRRGCRR
jgi:hypothetical protein